MEQLDNIIAKAELLKNENWLKSVESLQKALLSYEDNVRLLVSIGDVYSFKAKHVKAQEYYRQALNIDTKDESIIFRLADSHLACNQHTIAMQYLSRIKIQSPNLLYKKAIIAAQLQQDVEAEKYLTRLIELAPDFKSAYLLKIELILKRKDLKEVYSLIEKVKSTFGEDGQVAFIEGFVNFQQKMWFPAYSCFKRAVQMGFDLSFNSKFYGICCYKLGLYDKAEEILLKSLKKMPFDPVIYEYIVKTYIKTDNIAQANLFIKKVERTIPITKTLISLYNKIKYGK